MKYNISTSTPPKMPRLGKGTECVKILLSQVSKDMFEPLIPMLFPILGAHVSGSEFQYLDLTWKELCGHMANLVAESGGNKGQLSLLVEVIIRMFRVLWLISSITGWILSSFTKKNLKLEIYLRNILSFGGKFVILHPVWNKYQKSK